MNRHEELFDKFFKIISHVNFFKRLGIGNEIPYFIHAYPIQDQKIVYQKIEALVKRLELRGISVALFGLYDFTLNYFRQSDELEDLFELEPTVSKIKFLDEMMKMLSSKTVIIPALLKTVSNKSAQVAILWQVGEVYPYIRIHELLSNLQSELYEVPVIVFFPGEYITSPKEGYRLKLFGQLESNFYRAFKLEDYVVRGNIDDHN